MATKLIKVCDNCNKECNTLKTFYMSQSGHLALTTEDNDIHDLKDIDLCDECICNFLQYAMFEQKKFI